MRDIIVTSSVLIAAVLLIRYLVKGKINPVLQYALWLPVALRLVLPTPLFDSPVSILNLFPDDWVYQEASEDFGQAGSQADFPGRGMGNAGGQNAGVQKDGGLQDAGMQKGEELQDAGARGAGLQEADAQNAGMQKDAGLQDVSARGVGLQSIGAQDAAALQTEADNLGAQTAGIGTDAYQAGKRQVLPLLWGIGALSVGGYMFVYQRKWKRYLRKNRTAWNGGKKYRGVLSVYTVEGLPSPCLTGRSIYLTQEMAADERRLAHILAHEYCHYKHLDSLWVIVRCVLTAAYWFHPLVWAAAYLSKQDSELACDAAAIRLLGEKERIAYGKTLLQLIARDRYDKNKVGIASTMSGKENGIKERISLVAGKGKYVTVVSVLAVVLVAVIMIVTFSGKAQAENASGELDNISRGSTPSASNRQDVEAQSGLENAGLTQNELGNADQTQSGLENIEQPQDGLENLEQRRDEAQDLEQPQHELQDRNFGTEAARTDAVLKKLASYDADIAAWGSREGVFGIADAKDPKDFVQAYYDRGEEALEEGIYLLEMLKGPDSSDIKIYGMYTKEYGCEGIKILIADDCNDFDEPWLISYGYGREGNVCLYEKAEDGMPRTFAFKIPIVNTGDSEVCSLYLCDRYDTGTIALYQYKPEDYLAQMQERLSFKIAQPENKIYVYDEGKPAGEIGFSGFMAMKKIEDVILDGSVAGWEFDRKEGTLKLITAVGARLETGLVWYQGLNLLSFPIAYGEFGNREFALGQVSVESDYVNSMRQDSLEKAFQNDEAHHDLEIEYANPCPAYTRISNSFGSRVHPVTGKEMMHNGVDFAASEGADIVAAADGTVYETGFDTANGNYIVLYHSGSGEFTYYAHCKEIFAQDGEKAARGQKIASVGSTGASTGPHLHFALSRNGEYIAPVFQE